MPESNHSKFVDPRLQAKEEEFQKLHLSIYETHGYVQEIQTYVTATGHDIDARNPDYLQLLRDYEITKNMSRLGQSPLQHLCTKTDDLVSQHASAFANIAQLCAAATCALNHWRILNEIPTDLQSNVTITKALKEKFERDVSWWEHIINDLVQSASNPTKTSS